MLWDVAPQGFSVALVVCRRASYPRTEIAIHDPKMVRCQRVIAMDDESQPEVVADT